MYIWSYTKRDSGDKTCNPSLEVVYAKYRNVAAVGTGLRVGIY